MVVWAITSGALVVILGWMGLSLIVSEHLGRQQTGWREMVPRLVLGLVAAASSLWWCALVLDVADAVSGFIAVSLNVTAGDLLRSTLHTLMTGVQAGSVGMALLLAVLYLVYGFFVLYVIVQMVLRLALIDLLLALAPIALGLWILPHTARLLTELESRDGILDRRFYAVCEFGRIDDLRGLLARAGLSVHPLKGRQLRMFLAAAALGGSPTEFDEESPVEVEIGRRDVRIGGHLTRSLHLGKWPRSLAPGFLQGFMAAGAPMDLSVHLGPIPAEQAARTLEWQKVRFESAQSLSFKRGRTMSPEAEIALEDITRLRDEVQRGRERLFHASLSVTLHAKDEASLREMTQRAKAHFAATLGKLDNLAFRQREGLLSTLPLALNAVAEWRSLDTSSIARLFPFSPPDLDTRSGTLYGIDMRACSPVVYDPWDGGTHLTPTPPSSPAPAAASPLPPSWGCCGALPGE